MTAIDRGFNVIEEVHERDGVRETPQLATIRYRTVIIPVLLLILILRFDS